MRKIQYLDGIRGLAALAVVMNHFVLAFYPALFSGNDSHTHLKAGQELFISGSIFNLFYNGNFAVGIFFVLSGFLLSYRFFLQKDSEILTESAIKRYVRLVVPVSYSILFAFILMKFSLFYNQQAAEISGSYWLGGFWRFTPNLLEALDQIFVGTFFSNVFAYNVTLWTIAFEFTGSLMVLSFLALFGKVKNRYLVYGLAIIFFFQTYYLAFILGVILSDIVAHKDGLMSKLDRSKILRTGLLLVGVFLGSYPSTGRDVAGTTYAFLNSTFFNEPAIFYHALGAFLVILVLFDSKRMQRIFSFRPFVFLGEISFAMYLLHFIILGSFTSFIFLQLAPHLSYSYAVLSASGLSIGLILIVSYIMATYVDRRAVYLSKLLYERVFK